jgi:hypothetical protein
VPAEFPYDVFLSHSAKDKDVARALAERLRADGLKVWFDEWVLKAGDMLPVRKRCRALLATALHDADATARRALM